MILLKMAPCPSPYRKMKLASRVTAQVQNWQLTQGGQHSGHTNFNRRRKRSLKVPALRKEWMVSLVSNRAKVTTTQERRTPERDVLRDARVPDGVTTEDTGALHAKLSHGRT